MSGEFEAKRCLLAADATPSCAPEQPVPDQRRHGAQTRGDRSQAVRLSACIRAARRRANSRVSPWVNLNVSGNGLRRRRSESHDGPTRLSYREGNSVRAGEGLKAREGDACLPRRRCLRRDGNDSRIRAIRASRREYASGAGERRARTDARNRRSPGTRGAASRRRSPDQDGWSDREGWGTRAELHRSVAARCSLSQPDRSRNKGMTCGEASWLRLPPMPTRLCFPGRSYFFRPSATAPSLSSSVMVRRCRKVKDHWLWFRSVTRSRGHAM